jgi:hypothetical protein
MEFNCSKSANDFGRSLEPWHLGAQSRGIEPRHRLHFASTLKLPSTHYTSAQHSAVGSGYIPGLVNAMQASYKTLLKSNEFTEVFQIVCLVHIRLS